MLKPFLEENYELNYKKGWRPDPYGKQESIPVGQLFDMCSYAEKCEREQNGQYHKCECDPDTKRCNRNLMVKAFKRSSVGQENAKVDELRPWSVIRRTLHYLLLDICKQDVGWLYVSDFVFDRLKALRQDIVIQRIEGSRYIELLEGSVRFLIYSMYRLTCTSKDFSNGRNSPKKIITNEGLVKGLDNEDLSVVNDMKLHMTSLRECLNSLIVQYQENVPNSPNRALFEAVNLLVNLPSMHGHSFVATKFLSDPELRNSNYLFKSIFTMFKLHLSGHHLTALKQLPNLRDEPGYALIVLTYAPIIAQLQIDLTNLLKKLCSSPGPNKITLSSMSDIIIPSFLEDDRTQRLLFTQLLACQFDIYDVDTGHCDFDKNFGKPRHEFDRGEWELERYYAIKEAGGKDNETRIYALQYIVGKNWHFYQEVLNIHGLDELLDPTQYFIE